MIRWSSAPLLLAGAIGCAACTACHDSSAPAADPTAAASSPPSQASPPAADADGKSATADASNETIVHAEDDGKSFDVARGATVTFALPNNSGTGYIWTPTQVDPQVLAQQGDRTSEVSPDVPGAPKTDVYHFAAQSPGTTTVEMTLKRPFGAGKPARVVHVTVAVH
jgi:inhibitor of cysteine peptidase